MGYASNTRTRRNLAALRRAGWSILVTPDNPKPPEGFRYAADNGAWKAFLAGTEFDEAAFWALIELCGPTADFIVAPDIVAGGMLSLEFSLGWIARLAGLAPILLAVQDGMTAETIEAVLTEHRGLGIFLGGTTEWKLATMLEWGRLAARLDRHYHVGRVNTARRIRLAEEAGATSFDGTSATMYSCTLPLLDSARRQPNLFSPRVLKGAL